MKTIFALLPLLSLSLASPVFDQMPMGLSEQHPGFEGWDLNEMRLVQMEGQAPVWMAEWEKVYIHDRHNNHILSSLPID